MGYRAWARAGTALLLALTPSLSAFAQSAASGNPVGANATSVPILNPAAQAALQKAIAGNQRIEPSRDRWRNPAATLQFFGIRPTDTVIEIWPGQGWYTSVIGPYLKQGGGSLVVGHFDAASTNSSAVRQIVDAYRTRFASDKGAYGSVSVVPFGPRSGPLGLPGTADSVLTFRNIHNWMAQGWAEKAFGDFFLVLKPGGILGIEEHRGRTDEPQDPLARDGYVREDFVIQLAREAGFEFIGRSEINANPADTKDHPFGVWTLPPVSRTSPLEQRDDPGFDRTRYDAIGESDRMTLRFRKPLNATGAPPAPGTRWSPVIVAPAPAATPPQPRLSPPAAKAPVVRPTLVTPQVVAPSVVAPRPVTPTPLPPLPASPKPPSAPPVSSVNPANGEAVAPRTIDPEPKPKPATTPIVVPARINSPAPSVLPPPLPVETKPLVVPIIVPTVSPDAAVAQPAAPVAPPPPATPRLAPPPAAAPRPAAVRSAPRRSPIVAPRPAAPIAPGSAARPVPKAPPPAPVIRPAPVRPAAPPIAKAKAKAKAPAPAAARPVPRPQPPPIAKKKTVSPPAPVDPNKPDWVVPRRRS